MDGGDFAQAGPPVPCAESDERLLSFLSAIIENIPNMIFLKEDKALRFVLFNRAGEELLGTPRSELVGRNDHDFFPPEEADFFTAKDRAVLESGQMLDIAEEKIHTAKGERILHTKKLPIRVVDGARYLLGISEDITDRKQAEEAVARARDEAELANRAKSEFLGKMSHEIRTPLNAVIGFTDLVLDTSLTADQRELLQEVRTSSLSLLHLIDDLLDFSRIEAGALTLAHEAFSLRDVLIDSVKGLRARAEAKGLGVNLFVAPDLPDGLVGDPWRLRQIVTNLMANAIKFTDAGEVGLRVAGDPSERADLVRLHACVSDTGIGVDSQCRSDIYLPFVQADNSSTRRYGGAGLGLAISSRLVQMMGGRVWCESPSPTGTEARPGAVFHFTAECAMQQPVSSRSDPPALAGPSVPVLDLSASARDLRAGAHPAPSAPSLERPRPTAAPRLQGRGLRALLVEDNPVNQLVARCTLERWGFEVVVAAHGGLVLTALDEATVPFDVVVLDVLMPVMDGFQVTREIRSREAGSGLHIPVVALTARAMKGDRERCLESGMDAYVSKPFRATDLFAALRAVLPGRVAEDDEAQAR